MNRLFGKLQVVLSCIESLISILAKTGWQSVIMSRLCLLYRKKGC